MRIIPTHGIIDYNISIIKPFKYYLSNLLLTWIFQKLL